MPSTSHAVRYVIMFNVHGDDGNPVAVDDEFELIEHYYAELLRKRPDLAEVYSFEHLLWDYALGLMLVVFKGAIGSADAAESFKKNAPVMRQLLAAEEAMTARWNCKDIVLAGAQPRTEPRLYTRHVG